MYIMGAVQSLLFSGRLDSTQQKLNLGCNSFIQMKILFLPQFKKCHVQSHNTDMRQLHGRTGPLILFAFDFSLKFQKNKT